MAQSVFTWQVIARRGWMVVLGLFLGLAIGSTIGGISVSAGSSYAVKQQAPHPTPYQDGRLALTYARLLPNDTSVVAAVARATGLTPGDVRGDLRMSAEPNTNVVFVRFSSDNLGTSLAALRGFENVVRSQDDPTGTPLRQSMHQVSLPNGGIGFTRKRATLLGGAVGLLLAFVLALTCESRLPRVDDIEQLGKVLPVPVSQVSCRRLADALRAALRLGDRDGVGWAAVGGPSFAARGDAAAAEAGLRPEARRRALLVRRGTPVVQVEEAWRDFEGAGIEVVGAFLVHRDPLLRLPQRMTEVTGAAG